MKINIDELLGLPNMEVTDFSCTEKAVFITINSVTQTGLCPICEKPCSHVRCYTKRTIRDLPILGKNTYLLVKSRQFECRTCSRYFTEALDEIVVGNHGLSKRYEANLYDKIKGVNTQYICLKEDVCWATLNTLYKSYSDIALSERKIDLSKVKRISIDEISIKKGKKNFACVLRDPDSDTVIDFLEKRDMATLKAYFTEKGDEFCAQIQEVISDMWDGYVNLAGEKGIFKNAINVIDLFHFVQHLGTALDGERKQARKEFPQEEAFKNLKWAVLKSPEDINETEQLKLETAFSLSENLAKIYQLRIDFKTIFTTDCTKENGLAAINKWVEVAEKISSKSLDKFLVTVNNWKDKVCNYFTNRVTNAAMEGTNNHIRSIIRRSFGYVDFQSLRRRVLTECGDVP
jgi:transposase